VKEQKIFVRYPHGYAKHAEMNAANIKTNIVKSVPKAVNNALKNAEECQWQQYKIIYK